MLTPACRLLPDVERETEVLAEQDAGERRDDGDHLQSRTLRAPGGEHDRCSRDIADAPGDDADLVVAELGDQAPDDAAGERGDDARGDRGQKGARWLLDGRRRIGRVGERVAVVVFAHAVRSTR